ncbi:hypothetical protein OSW16_16885 [Pseudomonas putida]|uniref:hypothetical protein n=1 Tax=Pseudomonas putida TaxID=303 RepID=UPI00226D853B|nr:hypothetical protein [Pseudomonas putida]WAB96234.1 hypothetical protein OSW16_16885 [Pseudomonas putida]
MDTDNQERQYHAYQALKRLSELTADTMTKIAYGQIDSIDWYDTCRSHREAFDHWMEFADAQNRRVLEAPQLRGASNNASQRLRSR